MSCCSGTDIQQLCLKIFSFLDVSYQEFLRMFSFEILKISLYFYHLIVHVAIWYDRFGTYNLFFRIVQAIQQHWYLCLICNKIESFLPFGISRSGSFWCDTQSEFWRCFGSLGESVGHTCLLSPVYGYASPSSENYSKRPEEPFFLHQEVGLSRPQPSYIVVQ